MQGFDGEPYTEERVTEFFKSAYERLVNLKFVDKTETESTLPILCSLYLYIYMSVCVCVYITLSF